ncbi:bifunctional enoyl-CoA hydratase/phosphate acetyltransferase [Thermotoga profunda]|uniref:bifunctional enoyl-CoA hydratase/phosphate acetyltransferase n=1 Tax=Thermotoga profunda TaxID=1508420 RepID=UPI000596C920|nr:bifunctional enoyl-CoA hydratase/phosphate acetyltransferase [Thermotoga profunda]
MKSLKELVERAKTSGRKNIVVAGCEDDEAVKAARMAYEERIVEKIFLVGTKRNWIGNEVEFVHTQTEEQTAEESVKIVSSNRANILLKGLVKTSVLLKAVLNKEWGLRSSGLLSHVAVVEVPTLDRVVFITDGGMIIKPTLEEKVAIIKNAVDLMHKLGYEKPKVAIICAVETVNKDMPETIDASVISKMAQRGELKNCIVDGPLGLDNALNINAARVKNVKGEVAGQADLLVVPDIHSGNFLGKSALYFAGGKIAGLIVGAKAPIVVVSRADNAESKLLSIALAACVG